ncbi:MAG: hypothetical protein F4X81_08320 [Gammaproteobacteria bacterium]|nr:hypothetical protein [Chloroflexota bacterium]MXW49253.1 hypothetical protein [Gammaproteobacteria bacterium]MXX28927.1 hypothetical protein [Gammaproteobacteria bacterium]MYE51460.1 hypothetical protein [Gammaproteobacteria bacterium]MYF12489.1 hypothetical protein [Gammaproteobacteria bacterium]
MKTAISIRDEVFDAAERAAKELGISRSELYTTAVREFVARFRKQRVTERLDAVYAEDVPSGLDQGLVAMQSLSLPEERW